MERFSVMSLKVGFLTIAVVALMSAMVVSFTEPAPAMAQGPTPTPTDPLWLAYSMAREGLEEKFSVDLTPVRSWNWEQAQFAGGIDSCVDLEDGSSGRTDVEFGWNFTITDLFGKTYAARVSYDLESLALCDRVESSAPQPVADDGGDGGDEPAADLPAPVAGAAASGGFELGGHVLELNGGTVSAMNRAGMTWVKKQLRYNLGDDPGKAAGLIASADANGFNILLGIVGEPDQMGNYDDYINQYASFVGGVAALGADAIEVWNEPNIDREWPAGSINGATYTRMLAASYNSIKSASPGTLVISGAPAPTGFFGAAGCGSGGCNDDVFMSQMASAGAAQYMDCVGLHYNEGIIPPSAASGDPRGGYPTYFFQSMISRGYSPFGGTPVCFTELGYLSPEGFDSPLPASFGWAQNTTVGEHAAWLAEAATIASQSGRVRLMIVWNVDFPFYTATDPMGGYAMIRPGGACPACDSLGTVMGG